MFNLNKLTKRKTFYIVEHVLPVYEILFVFQLTRYVDYLQCASLNAYKTSYAICVEKHFPFYTLRVLQIFLFKEIELKDVNSEKILVFISYANVYKYHTFSDYKLFSP